MMHRYGYIMGAGTGTGYGIFEKFKLIHNIKIIIF
jgi:hypothetical protein